MQPRATLIPNGRARDFRPEQALLWRRSGNFAMMLDGDLTLALGYTNRTQQTRRITEDWIARNGYCLRCDSDRLTPTPANTRTLDFVCERCSHGYELKSKLGSFSNRVLDGAYGTMLSTIREGRTPTFLLLEYSHSWLIQGLRAIHHSLITETAIEPRKPLSSSARRAGWIGCNIILPEVALQGQIPILINGLFSPKTKVRDTFARLEKLSCLSSNTRAWATTVLRLTERLERQFSLEQMYGFERELQFLFPNNRHIRPKIRQQLQVLRDAGLITFCGRGRYERNITS
jgi:type II restriction enzyme